MFSKQERFETYRAYKPFCFQPPFQADEVIVFSQKFSQVPSQFAAVCELFFLIQVLSIFSCIGFANLEAEGEVGVEVLKYVPSNLNKCFRYRSDAFLEFSEEKIKLNTMIIKCTF